VRVRLARDPQLLGGRREDTVRVRCHPCGEWLDVPSPDDLEDHIRVVHPDLFTPLERWPDGQVVVGDDTLTPRDFEEGGDR